MFHRFIRLLFLLVFFLSTGVMAFAQCLDTHPLITGPDVVGVNTTSVKYFTPPVTDHYYNWKVTELQGGIPVGTPVLTTNTTGILNQVWSAPGDYLIELSEGITSLPPQCTPVPAVSMNVLVKPMLAAYFYYEFDAAHGCYYYEVTFTATGNGVFPPADAAISYQWVWGEYNPPTPVTWVNTNITPIVPNSSIVKIEFPPTSGKTYATKLVVKKTISGRQWTDEITDFVYVDPDKYKPSANINSITPPIPNCLYNQYTFSSAGSLPSNFFDPTIKIKYCDWYVNGVLVRHKGDGVVIPCSDTAMYTFPSPGTYSIELVVTNTINCQNSITTSVIVSNTVPIASFTDAQACVNEPTPFTDKSFPGSGSIFITDWWWYWDDGSGTEHYWLPGNPPPVPVPHVFTDLLPHNVTLKVMNSNGCVNTTIASAVTAQPSPKADFTYPVVNCTGDVVAFNSDLSSALTGSPIASFFWDFDDPSSPSPTSTDPNPTHLFSGPGSYHVQLTVTNEAGCANTKSLITNPLVVNPHPDIEFTSVIGATVYIRFFDAQINLAQHVGSNVYWDFGDGTSGAGDTITHQYPGPGNYTASCMAIDMLTGCSSTVEHLITIGSTPAPCFTANPPNQCQNIPILFEHCLPGGDIFTEDWDFGDGSPIVHFDFPDVPASPNHSYTAPGPYHVTRVLNQGTALEATFDLWVNIFDAPIANFIWYSDPASLHQSQACDGQDVYFKDRSFTNATPAGTMYQWYWDFDDPLSAPNHTSTLQNPTHTFTSVANGGKTSYNVTLKAWENLQNCPSAVTQINVPINPPIPVEFSYNDNVCVDQTVNFTTDPLVLPPADYTWHWDFGDGNTSPASGNVSNLYASVGNYIVTLTLTDVNGCSKSKQHTVVIIPKPIANFSFTSPSCFGQAIQFTSLSFVPLPYNDVIVNWDWDFGDGLGTATGTPTPSYTYPTYSAIGYNVTLTVTTNRGCTEVKTINVQQIPSPIAGFEITAGTFSCVAPQSIQFNSSAHSQTNGGGAIVSWNWDFGDFSNSTLQDPSHVYATAGTKTVTLTVTNTNGCSNTVTHDVIINALPVADFTTGVACEGMAMQFTNASSTPPGTTVETYNWNFGDGGTSILESPNHSYATFGIYTVTLTIVNSNGCIHSVAKQVTIHPNPIAEFAFSPATCIGNPVSFTNLSFIPSGFAESIHTWEWDFDDGSAPVIFTFPDNPNIIYTFLGTSTSHNVKLTVTSTNGCIASIIKTVNSIPSPIANFSVSNTRCIGQLVQFTDLSSFNGGGSTQSWAWDFGDPLSGTANTSNLQHPTHTFNGIGPFTVKLTITSTNGCVSTYTGPPLTINELPIANFTYNNACEGTPTTFTNTSNANSPGGFQSYSWGFGDGGVSSLPDPQHLYLSYGNYVVTLTVVNNNGCAHTVNKAVIVNPKPIADFSFSAESCVGNPVNFINQSTVPSGFASFIQTWQWDFGDGSVTPPITFPDDPNKTWTFLGTATSHVVRLTVTTFNGCTSYIEKTVTSVAAPLANFSNFSNLCLNQPTQFTDLSQPIGGILTWSWNFGDPLSGTANNSTLQNPAHSFTATGNFIVTLTVTTSDGCINTYTPVIPVNINALPTANFTNTDACEGFPTTFTNTSLTPGGTLIESYSWNFGDGGTSPLESPQHVFATYGIYNVTLTISNSNGCIHTVTKQVLVNPKPIADFSFSVANCVGAPVSFFNQSSVPSGFSANIQTWQWEFGDGSPVPAPIQFPGNPNVSHIFMGNATSHVVRLTVTTTTGCVSFIEKTVTSVPAPIANFSFSTILCDNQPVLFTDLSQSNGGGNIQTWNWNFGDTPSGVNNTSTVQNPIHQFSSANSFDITLIVTNGNGCKDTLLPRPTVVVNARPFSDFEADTACQGSLTTFTDMSTPLPSIAGYLWDFGDGQSSTTGNPTHLYATTGNFNVKLTVTNNQGCVKDTTKQVLVLGKPVSSFSYSSPNCAGDSVQFTDLSTTPHGSIQEWTWDFGDGTIVGPISFPNNQNIKHKYTNGGNYNVKLTILTSDGCTVDKISQVQIGFSPLANFSFGTSGCALTPLQFTDLSQTNGGPSITVWNWNFGDPASGANNISTTQNPTHAFTSGGIDTVRLIVTNANGCLDTIKKTVTINAAPVAIFSADTSCLASPTLFTDASTTPTGTIAAWLWNFGDPASGANNTSTMQHPTHIYLVQGTYFVKLQVTNSSQCVKDTTMQIVVNPKPAAMFQYAASCVNTGTLFTDMSTAPGSSIKNWTWDFGDGSPVATVQNPTHTYTSAGTYQVKLKVSNLANCDDSVTIPVISRPTPVGAYTYIGYFCPKGKVDFQDISTATGSTIAQREWTFEPGYTSNSPNPSHTFPITDKKYLVSLVVTDTYGCKDTIADSVYVKPGFTFAFINDTVCQGYITHFTPVNKTPGDTLYSVTWNFGDPGSGPNNISQVYSPMHTFTGPGTYIVKMKAYNSDNCVDSVYREVKVYESPKPMFTFVSTPCDSTIYFNDSTVNSGSGTIASWQWIFGDGSPDVIINAPASGDTSHLYVDAGIYQVTLIMTNSRGCVDSITRSVQRFPCIKAEFTFKDTLCARYKIAFSDNSLPVTRINQWHWSWGDGTDTTYSTHSSPIMHTYADSGSYNVDLEIQASVNGTNIIDNIVNNVKIRPTPKTYFSNVPVCLNQISLFSDTSKTYGQGVSKWDWTFSSKATDTSSFKNPTHKYDTAGIYNVKLVVRNKFGCMDSLTKPTRIYGLPLAQYTNTPACTGDATLFTDRSVVSDTTLKFWRWSFGDSLKGTSSLQDPIYKYQNAGDYSIRMIVKDNYGCIDTIDSTVRVNITPVSAFTVVNEYNSKQGQVKINNLSTGAESYNWDFGNGKYSTEQNPVALYTEDGTYTIKLISLNQFDCSDTTFYNYELLFKGLYVPNAFSPTSTNLGIRLFQPIGVNLKQYHVSVFDMWGHLLWESTKLYDDPILGKGIPQEGWDGTFEGAMMPQGNYMWRISALFVDDSQWEGSDIGFGNSNKTMGTVSLIR